MSLLALPVLSVALLRLGVPQLLPVAVPEAARHLDTDGGLEAGRSPPEVAAELPSSLGWWGRSWV